MTTEYTDERRVQGSALVSFSFHGLLLALYLILKAAQPKPSDLMLTQVEFLDLQPTQAVESAPAQRAPRGIRDLLLMALPKFKPEQSEPAPRDVETLREAQLPKLPETRRLVDKSQGLVRGPALQLKSASVPRNPSANITDIAARASPKSADLAAIAEPQAISLEATGRTAVRGTGPAIRIDAGASAPRSSRLTEMPTSPSPSSLTAAPSAGGRAGIELKEGIGPERPGRPAPASTPLGYGRGISLQERPVARAAPAVLPTPKTPGSQSSKPAAELERTNKAVEISGPLAGRKIVSISLPQYPEWARSRGVEADVVIRFFVSPEGRVLDRMILERTSGYKELDDLGMEALQKMVFVPLPTKEDQWGLITFRFRLK